MTLPASGPISLYQIADEFGVARTTAFPSWFYGKGGAPSSGPLSFSDFYGRSGTSPISATVSPTSISQSGSTSTITTASSATCTATGGTGPYTYAWAQQDGDAISIVSSSSSSTAFRATVMTSGESRNANFACTVTDSAGHSTTSGAVNVSISR